MHGSNIGFLSKASARVLDFLLRLYLLPLKKILYANTAPRSAWNKIRTHLKKLLAGNQNLLAQVLDPEAPELLEVLSGNRMRILTRLLKADNARLLQAYLEQPENPAKEALFRFFHPGAEAVSELMLEDDAVRLKQLLPPESTPLRDLVFSEDAVRLKSILPPESKQLRDLMFCENASRLRYVLSDNRNMENILAVQRAILSPDSKLLYYLMYSEDASRLKAVLVSGEYYRNAFLALKECLGVESALLHDLLATEDSSRLRNALQKDGGKQLKRLFGEGSPLLHAALAEGNYKVLRAYLFDNKYEILMKVIRHPGTAIYDHLLLMDNSDLVHHLAYGRKGSLLKTVLFEKGLMHAIVQLHGARKWFKYEERINGLAPWIALDENGLQARIRYNREQLICEKSVREAVIDTLCTDGVIPFRQGAVYCNDRPAVYTLLDEIFVKEDYFADLGTDEPYILDLGSHQGFSLFYFKALYPKAHIIGFEPDPENCIIAEDNMRRNNFRDVEVLPYAVAAEAGTQRFFLPCNASMAGSLTTRWDHLSKEVAPMREIEVPCVPLSRYLQRDIDYLKMDIEGAEYEVLQEAASCLYRVKYLFCEYHHGLGLPTDRLARILDLLNACNFEVHVTKSHGYYMGTQKRPMSFVGKSDSAYSAILFAKNKTLNKTDSVSSPDTNIIGTTQEAEE